MFRDRTDAGAQLADELEERGVQADLVLAIPRGGLPVGRAVADRLGVPLGVVVASKLGAPGNPELALGAVAADGSVWLNDELVARLSVDDAFVERERAHEAANAREKVAQYRADEPLPDVAGKHVVVVDDGLATGATAIACLRQVRAGDAARVVLAVPVAARGSLEQVRAECDDLVAVELPPSFRAVGFHYQDFGQVSDEEAIGYLTDGE